MQLARILDPANVMSLIRVPLALAVWLRPHDPVYLLGVVALAAISDGLDGWLGRRTHAALTGTQNVGAWLDPLCDKIFIGSAALAVVSTYEVAPLVLGLVLFRDVAIGVLVVVFRVAAGRHTFHAHDFRATASGKVTTAAQVATIAAIVAAPDLALPCALAAALIGAVAVVDRVQLALRTRADAGA